MSVRAMKWAYGLFEVTDLPPAERGVLLALCWDHTDAQGCFPSQDRVARLSGYRVRKVRDLLKSLEAGGLIGRSLRRTQGKYQHTEYRLFGTYQRQKGASGKSADHQQKKAGGHHRHTGADYRGNNTCSAAPTTNVVTFPFQKFENSGGA